MYTVREVAEMAHTTVKTLHHYHKIGLLIPRQTTEAGYRLYGKSELERLQQILFYRALDFSLKDIGRLLDGEVQREQTLRRQRTLLKRKIDHFARLVQTIDRSIQHAKEGADEEMARMFQGFENEKEWQDALRTQNEHLQKEYDVDLLDRPVDVASMNEAALEAQSFTNAMISFLQEGFSPDDPKVFRRVKTHLAFLEQAGHPSTAEDVFNQTAFFIADDFHRKMMEQQQVGYAYYLYQVAMAYKESE